MEQRWIAAILIAFVALGTLYSVVVPIFEAPDEVWHYLYVKHFADGNGLPVYQEGITFPMRQEASQPPLFYALHGLATAWIDTGDADQLVRYNPHAAVGTATPWGNRNMVAHSAQESFPYRGTVLAVHLVRCSCVLMGAGTVLCTFAIARRLFPSFPWLALAAAALNAFNPQFLFINASVSNDVLVTLLSAVSLWLLVCMAQDGPAATRLLALGVILGLAALTKLSGLLLLPLTATVLLMLSWRARSWRAATGWGLWTFVPTAAIAGWWYLRNWMLYRDPFGLKLMFVWFPPRTQRLTLQGLLKQWIGVFKSFWGVFGWFNVPMDDGIYAIMAVATLLGFLGLVRFLGPRFMRRQWGDLARSTLLLLWAAVYILGSVGWSQVVSSQGRLLFPAMPAIAILLCLGLAQWFPTRYARHSLAMLMALLLCLAAIVPSRYIAPAYTRPASETADGKRTVGGDLAVDLGGQVQLLSYGLSETTVRVNSRLWVTLCWEALRPIAYDHSAFIHLVDDRGVIIAQRDSWPGAGNDPTSSWQVGQARCDQYPLDVPTSVLAQSPCRVQVGLYDPSTGQRLPINSLEGRVLGFVVLPAILELEGSPVSGLQEVQLEFEGQIALTGYAVQPIVAHPGDTLQITLRWQALRTVREHYIVFVQLLRGGDQIWGQSDHVPRDGQAPTSLWIANQVVTEALELRISADAPEDSYQLIVGLYEPDTIRRLKLPDGTDVVVLGQIDVRR